MEAIVTILGYLAAFLTTISFLPQTIKSIKEKNTDGISLVMYSLFTVGVLLWLVYGVSVKDIPIMAANGITLIFSLTILVLKIKHTIVAKN